MTSPHTPAQPHQLQDEIEQTRSDLGDTVEALTAKTDVKTRTRQALSSTTDRARQQFATAKTTTVDAANTAKARVTEASKDPRVRRAAPPAAIAVVVAAVVGVVIVVSRRRQARSRAVSWLPGRR